MRPLPGEPRYEIVAPAVLLLLLLAGSTASAGEIRTSTAAAAVPGPRLELPPEREPDKEIHTALPRETPIETPLGAGPVLQGSAFGGYGELTLNARSDRAAVVDLRRVVLFFGHNFNERFRFYSELEIEHAVASSSDQGEIEVEQAYIDALLDKRFNLRGGLVLMPAGIINIYHEPPSFNGVDRPAVDNQIIPTTWREPGIGVFGEIVEGLRYQAYLVTGFNANGFTAKNVIRDGHQEAELSHAGDFGAIVRLDFEPVLGAVFGASGYLAASGNTLEPAAGRVPVALVEADLKIKRGSLSVRGEVAFLAVGDALALNRALQNGTSDQMAQGPVAAQAIGGYGELGYDVFRIVLPESEEALVAFVRYDYVDTQASVPAPFAARPELRVHSGTLGLSYKPIPELAFKADVRRHHAGDGSDANEIASAITWMF